MGREGSPISETPTIIYAEEYLNDYLKDQADHQATELHIGIYGVGPVINSVRRNLDGIDGDIRFALGMFRRRHVQKDSILLLKIINKSPFTRGKATPIFARMISLLHPFLSEFSDSDLKSLLDSAATSDISHFTSSSSESELPQMPVLTAYRTRRISTLERFQSRLRGESIYLTSQ